MQVGVFAKTFAGGDPDTVFAAARAAGFEAVQYNMACSGLSSLPLEIADDTASAIARAATVHGIEVVAVSATYNMIHPVAERLEQGRRAAVAIAACAARVGAKVLTLCTGSADPLDQWRHHPDNGTPQSWRKLLREFEYLVPLAERHGLMLGVEPELGNVVSSAHVARRVIDTLRSDRIGIILDPANLFEIADRKNADAIVAEAIDLIGDRIVMAHAKDRTADGGFAPPGGGVIDFDDFVHRLRDTGFDGPLVGHGFGEQAAPGVAAFLQARIGKSAAVA
jgi:sugar phosphate isomerase/epimerase